MQNVMITGAGSGLGAALVKAFLSSGSRVAATVRNRDNAVALNRLASLNPSLCVVELDLLDTLTIDKAIQQVYKRFGSIDVLINNAGLAIPAATEEAQSGQSRLVMETNFWGPLQIIQKTLPYMRQQGSGTILNISSLSAHIGLPCDGMYSASKIALERACESLKSEVAPFGIRVCNAIPGKIQTAMARKMHESAQYDKASAYHPLLNRLIEEMQGAENSGANPDEIAAEVLALVEQGALPLHAPVGGQARGIMLELMLLTEQQRNELISRFSLSDWWLNNAR